MNAIAPGPVWTPLNPVHKEAKDVAQFDALTPMKRLRRRRLRRRGRGGDE